MRRVYKFNYGDLISYHGNVFAIEDVHINTYPEMTYNYELGGLPPVTPKVAPSQLIMRGREIFSHNEIKDELEEKVMKLLEDLERYGKRLSKFRAISRLGAFDIDTEMLQWMNEAIETVNK